MPPFVFRETDTRIRSSSFSFSSVISMGSAFSGFEVPMQAEKVASPSFRGLVVAVVGSRKSAVREQEQRDVAFGLQIERDGRAVPARDAGGDGPPAHSNGWRQLVHSHFGDDLMIEETKLARSADSGIEHGVTRPPASNPFGRRERLIGSLGRGVNPG